MSEFESVLFIKTIRSVLPGRAALIKTSPVFPSSGSIPIKPQTQSQLAFQPIGYDQLLKREFSKKGHGRIGATAFHVLPKNSSRQRISQSLSLVIKNLNDNAMNYEIYSFVNI